MTTSRTKRDAERTPDGPGFFAGLLALVLLAGNIFLAHSLLVGEGGLPAFLRLRDERARLQEDMDKLVAERAQLSRNIQLLKADDAFAERIVREQTRFVRQDEIVYFVNQASPQQPHKASPEQTR